MSARRHCLVATVAVVVNIVLAVATGASSYLVGAACGVVALAMWSTDDVGEGD